MMAVLPQINSWNHMTYLFKPIDIIRHFTPNWFTVNMGTGIVALLITELPFMQNVLFQIGSFLWLLNILLFSVFSILYILRWLLFFREAKLILDHPSMLFFLGAIPMALTTLINGTLKYGQELFNIDIIPIVELVWYFNALLAIFVALFVPAMMFTRQKHELTNMTAIWLLPIVAAEVVASSGGILLGSMSEPEHKIIILLFSYMLWGLSVLPAFSILTILFLRMALHQLPSKQLSISGCLALGPIGTGALALLLLGKQAPQVFNHTEWSGLGHFLHYAGILGATVLIGFGIWWFVMAVFTIYKGLNTTFNLGFWGLTFPLGVYTLAILELAKQLHIQSLAYVGYSLVMCIITLWVFIFFNTLKGAYRGHLFFSPCLMAALQRK